RSLRTRHSESLLDWEEFDLSEMLARYGEPFADPSIIPTFAVSRLASRDVKVVLSGDGGDEVFGGYTWLTAALDAFVLPARDLRVRAKRAVRSLLSWLPGSDPIADPLHVFNRAVSCFDSSTRRRLWRPELRAKAERPSVIEQSRKNLAGLDLCSQIQWLDLAWDLPGDILAKVDIASMTYGLEVRVPLLDHRLVELALHLPFNLKYRRDGDRTVSRIAERRVAERHLTGGALSAPKRGFGIPLRRGWSRERQGEMADRIARGRSPLSDYFDPSRLHPLTEENRPAGDDLKVWVLDVLDTWLTADRTPAAPTYRPPAVEVGRV
ncbi:MAG: asparagine synthase-related protein, partial [Fimbriimonadales bacterium]